MKAVILLLTLCGICSANQLASIQLPGAGTDIAFGVSAVGGTADVFHVNAIAGEVYSVPLSDVQQMFAMVSNPGSYTMHGPLWVSFGPIAGMWTSSYDSLSYSHNDAGFGGHPVATVVGSDAVLHVPWQSVLVTGSSVRIFDTAVPEPGYSLSCFGVLLAVVVLRRAR